MIAVYEWPAGEDCLLSAIYPDALRIRARIGERAGDVLMRVPLTVRTFIFHIDLTDSSRMPLDRQAVVDSLRIRGVNVVNGDLTDISKRRIDVVCQKLSLPRPTAPRSGDPGEPHIIKTDRNYGGLPEKDLQSADAELLSVVQPQVTAIPLNYPIVPRREIPVGVWDDPRLVVQRYISNVHNRFFRAFVNRDRMVISVGLDAEPIKRLPWGTLRQDCYFIGGRPVDWPTPKYSDPRLRVTPELQQMVGRFCYGLRLQFGAIDIVEDDRGTHFIVDANATPGWGRPDLAPIADFLAIPPCASRCSAHS